MRKDHRLKRPRKDLDARDLACFKVHVTKGAAIADKLNGTSYGHYLRVYLLGMLHPAANRHPIVPQSSIASYGRPSLPFASPYSLQTLHSQESVVVLKTLRNADLACFILQPSAHSDTTHLWLLMGLLKQSLDMLHPAANRHPKATNSIETLMPSACRRCLHLYHNKDEDNTKNDENMLSPSIGWKNSGSIKTCDLCVHPAIYQIHISPSTYLSIQLSIYISVYLSLSLSVSLSISQPIYPSIHPTIRPSIWKNETTAALQDPPNRGAPRHQRWLAHSRH